MARSRITQQGVQLNNDNGSILFSVIDGEMTRYQINPQWITNLNGYTIDAKIVEAQNSGGQVPTAVKDGGITTNIKIRYQTGGDASADPSTATYNDLTGTNGDSPVVIATAGNVGTTTTPVGTFELIMPADLIASWSPQPAPDSPVYGFFGLEISDSGEGASQQIWKPMRGLVEVLYSATE